MSPATTSETTPGRTGGSGGASAPEFEPPLACVRRLLKHTLPSSTNVGKDASTAFSRACGIFVIYITACANDFARESRRQTITAKDVMAALKELDFDEFTPQLTAFLEQYRKQEKNKKEAKKAAEALKAAEELPDHEVDDDDGPDHDTEQSKERPLNSSIEKKGNKRRKLDDQSEATDVQSTASGVDDDDDEDEDAEGSDNEDDGQSNPPDENADEQEDDDEDSDAEDDD